MIDKIIGYLIIFWSTIGILYLTYQLILFWFIDFKNYKLTPEIFFKYIFVTLLVITIIIVFVLLIYTVKEVFIKWKKSGN